MPTLNVPGWALYTITGMCCFGGGVWTASRVFSGVENTANAASDTAREAKGDVASLAPRVTALEIQNAAATAKYESMLRQLESLSKKQDEAAADIKTLLSRTVPK